MQARLRMGDTPEDLEPLTDLSLDQIKRFARPVDAEKSEIISRVQKHPVVGTDGTKTSVGALALARLAARGVAASDLAWTARRDVGAPWLVELKYDGDTGHERAARWTFDHKLNVLTALDDDARWLSQADEPTRQPVLDVPSISGLPSLAGRRESKLAAEALASDEPAVSGAPAPHSIPVPVARARTGSTRRIAPRQVVGDAGTNAAVANIAGRVGSGSASGGSRAGGASGANGGRPDMAGIVSLNQWQAGKTDTLAVPVVESVPPPAASPAAAPPATAAGKPAAKPVQKSAATPAAKSSTAPAPRKGAREQVPSWDEIVFGSRD